MSVQAEDDKNVFKRVQNKHRRRGDDPNRADDLEDLIDFNSNFHTDNRIIRLELPKEHSSQLSDLYHGPIYGLKDFPGFLYAPQALAKPIQLELAYRSVSEYCERPHRTNIDLCPPKQNEEPNDNENMWELWKKDLEQHESNSKKKMKPDPNATRKYRSFKKLSWATMGYHYDWTQRAYHEGRKSNMPSLVRDIAIKFARTSLLFDIQHDTAASSKLQFTPSASIVNYYNLKSVMGGHKDDLELATDKPIISISLGLPAIFVLGGKSKEEEPVLPILVRPGDVMCMGGQSRMNIHGMARLLPVTVTLPEILLDKLTTTNQRVSLDSFRSTPETCLHDAIPEADAKALDEYLSQHRININVRQVYPDT